MTFICVILHSKLTVYVTQNVSSTEGLGVEG